ncbi:MAG TPA: hypothetical protein VE621_24690, partial [Bryobacteraceae bacterium]|nr:hypothetical protein [Bryobacteraceae bacterium]
MKRTMPKLKATCSPLLVSVPSSDAQTRDSDPVDWGSCNSLDGVVSQAQGSALGVSIEPRGLFDITQAHSQQINPRGSMNSATCCFRTGRPNYRPRGGYLSGYSERDTGRQSGNSERRMRLWNPEALMKRRRMAELRFRRINEEVEKRVVERTAEIADANRELAKQNEELARATRTNSELLARTTHEIRTVLHSIVGFADLMAEESEG